MKIDWLMGRLIHWLIGRLVEWSNKQEFWMWIHWELIDDSPFTIWYIKSFHYDPVLLALLARCWRKWSHRTRPPADREKWLAAFGAFKNAWRIAWPYIERHECLVIEEHLRKVGFQIGFIHRTSKTKCVFLVWASIGFKISGCFHGPRLTAHGLWFRAHGSWPRGPCPGWMQAIKLWSYQGTKQSSYQAIKLSSDQHLQQRTLRNCR